MQSTAALNSEHEGLDCPQCGASLRYSPGSASLACTHCGYQQTLGSDGAADADINELDYQAQLAELAASSDHAAVALVRCGGCGAEFQPEPHCDAGHCAFCGTAFVNPQLNVRQLAPSALLPFVITQANARQAFQRWLKKRWFLPNSVKHTARLKQGLKGVYLPFWTYDSHSNTRYVGQRGTYYYVPRTYTTRVNGRTVTRTRMERRIRWRYCSGGVALVFDDLLVPASRAVPQKRLAALAPWPLEQLKPFHDHYLAGFNAERYQLGLAEGFEQAKGEMNSAIRRAIKRDIGGDEQRIVSAQSAYSNIQFKHILLPVWLSVFSHKQTCYQVLVNAQTGEVQGERPWSVPKIASVVAAGVGVLGIVSSLLIASQQAGSSAAVWYCTYLGVFCSV